MCILFAVSFLTGGIVFMVPERNRKVFAWAVIGALVLINVFFCYRNKYQNMTVKNAKEFIAKSFPEDNGAFLPVWVKEVVVATPPVKLGPLKGQADIVDRGGMALDRKFSIQAASPAVLCYYAYYFPGWEVYVDGSKVKIDPGNPYGFMVFMVPEGKHEVRVHWGTTPVRLFSDIVSLTASALLLLAAFFTGRSGRQED